MSAKTLPARVQIESSETENDRFKRSFESWLWGSMIAGSTKEALQDCNALQGLSLLKYARQDSNL